MKQLNEKVAIVTGAGQGIGKGIALCLAKRGVKVVCTGRRLEPIEETVAEIKAAMETLTQKVYQIFGKLYQQQGGEGQPQQGPEAGSQNPDGTYNADGSVH